MLYVLTIVVVFCSCMYILHLIQGNLLSKNDWTIYGVTTNTCKQMLLLLPPFSKHSDVRTGTCVCNVYWNLSCA